MKYLYALTLLTSLGLSACKKDAATTDYDRSYNAWQSFKQSAGNSYSYITYGGSVFGYHAESKITVQNGKVVARDFVSERYAQGTDSIIVIASWSETGSALNSHDNGFESLTLDQVYAKAKSEWLNVSKKNNDVYFEAANNGMLSSAGYVPKGCQDDCFTGIRIKEIKIYVKEIN